jgi:hypothetical protein
VEDNVGEPDVDLVFEVRNGRPECRQVRIRATEQGREVQAFDLDRIHIQELLEAAIRYMWIGMSGDEKEEITLGLEAVRQTRSARAARKITDAMLREVAEVYRKNVSNRPTAAVAEHFGKEHRDALRQTST